MDTQSPLISSFVIRFVMNEAQESVDELGQSPYRGSIRHVQSDEELNFHLWEDAIEFIRRYVPLDHGPVEFTGTETGPDGA
jgi:hypothetical protein